jgi:hypothetical protein
MHIYLYIMNLINSSSDTSSNSVSINSEWYTSWLLTRLNESPTGLLTRLNESPTGLLTRLNERPDNLRKMMSTKETINAINKKNNMNIIYSTYFMAKSPLDVLSALTTS